MSLADYLNEFEIPYKQIKHGMELPTDVLVWRALKNVLNKNNSQFEQFNIPDLKK